MERKPAMERKYRRRLAEALGNRGIDASVDKEGWLRITCYMKHGEEKDIDIPPGADCVEWMGSELDTFDESYAAYVWLDEFGHGRHGAPHDMEDVLADQKQWTRTMKTIRKTMKETK